MKDHITRGRAKQLIRKLEQLVLNDPRIADAYVEAESYAFIHTNPGWCFDEVGCHTAGSITSCRAVDNEMKMIMSCRCPDCELFLI